jgi:hypothetical protein
MDGLKNMQDSKWVKRFLGDDIAVEDRIDKRSTPPDSWVSPQKGLLVGGHVLSKRSGHLLGHLGHQRW